MLLELSYIKECLHVPLCMGEELIKSEVLYVCIERVPPPSTWLFVSGVTTAMQDYLTFVF